MPQDPETEDEVELGRALRAAMVAQFIRTHTLLIPAHRRWDYRPFRPLSHPMYGQLLPAGITDGVEAYVVTVAGLLKHVAHGQLEIDETFNKVFVPRKKSPSARSASGSARGPDADKLTSLF